jgi:hypothetical protein
MTPGPAWFDALVRWLALPLSATVTRGEAFIFLPLAVSWLVSTILSTRYAHRWLRRRGLRWRWRGNGLTMVSRANFRREGYRTLRLTLWLATAIALLSDHPLTRVVFTLTFLIYVWTELLNALLEWAYQGRMERALRRLPVAFPPPAASPPAERLPKAP